MEKKKNLLMSVHILKGTKLSKIKIDHWRQKKKKRLNQHLTMGQETYRCESWFWSDLQESWVDLQALNCPRTQSSKLFSCCSHFGDIIPAQVFKYPSMSWWPPPPRSYISNLDLPPGLRFTHLMAYLIFPLGYFKSQLLIASLKSSLLS